MENDMISRKDFLSGIAKAAAMIVAGVVVGKQSQEEYLPESTAVDPSELYTSCAAECGATPDASEIWVSDLDSNFYYYTKDGGLTWTECRYG
jgi:hypothetical protein